MKNLGRLDTTLLILSTHQVKVTVIKIQKKERLLKCAKYILKFHISTIYSFVVTHP